MANRIRRNIAKLPAGNDTVLWYARAVAEMKKRPIADPTSWRYQAAIHDYNPAADPLRQPNDVLPSATEQKQFWRRCNHGSWFFLPWHRMYLHHFEKIVAATVKKLGGPADWALPYWNYSEGASSRLLPTGFRKPTWSGPGVNPLFVAARDPRANAGQPFADAIDVDLTDAMRELEFESAPFGGSAGVGGPATKFEHSGGRKGQLEITPHDQIHGAVAGPGGWMGNFTGAPLDPIFWIHHCNIDRLWQVWRNVTPPPRVNPTKSAWLSDVSFKFHDAKGNVVTMTAQEVEKTTSSPLSYDYDDTSSPIKKIPGVPLRAPRGLAMAAKKQKPEMVGASSKVKLGVKASHTTLDTKPPTAPAGAKGLRAAPRRAFLNIENVRGTGRAPAYDVYLNVPSGEDPLDRPDLHVGRLPMFGLEESTTLKGAHSGSGLHYTFEITEKYPHLSKQPGWNPKKLRVSFVPVRDDMPAKVEVGRVSLYFS